MSRNPLSHFLQIVVELNFDLAVDSVGECIDHCHCQILQGTFTTCHSEFGWDWLPRARCIVKFLPRLNATPSSCCNKANKLCPLIGFGRQTSLGEAVYLMGTEYAFGCRHLESFCYPNKLRVLFSCGGQCSECSLNIRTHPSSHSDSTEYVNACCTVHNPFL